MMGFVFRHTKLVMLIILVVGLSITLIPLIALHEQGLKITVLDEAKSIARVMTSFRSLYTSEVADRLKNTKIKITHNYENHPNAIPLPATLSLKLGASLSNDGEGGAVLLYSPYPFPWRKKEGGLKDDFAKKAWSFLDSNPNEKSYYRYEEINGINTLRYAVADRLGKACLNCHNTHPQTPKNDWKISQLRGLIEVQRPVRSAYKESSSYFIIDSIIEIIATLILVILIWYFLNNSKKAILTLKKSQYSLENLKYALDETAIFATTDSKGKINFVNDKFCKISKYSRDDLIGKDHRILNSGHHTKEFMENLWKTIIKKEVWRGEVKNVDKDGSFYWVDTTIIPLSDEIGKIYQFAAIRFDITVKKEQEEKLKIALIDVEKRNTELDQFAYVVSHDLKAPLRAIHSLTEFIKEDMGDDLKPEVDENFELLRGRVNRMESLILGILEYSKVGRVSATKEVIETNIFLKEIIDAIEPPEHFNVVYSEDLPKIKFNKVYLTQIFQNIVSNAIKYHDKDKGNILINYQEEQGFHHFSIKDDGPGIDKEYHEKVFGVFKTLQARDSLESTGVGLAVVKKIIEQSGGKIWIESDIGKGATFHFCLPK